MAINKSISVTLPGGEEATVAVVKAVRQDPEPVYIYDLCREEQQQEGEAILITLQADSFAAPEEAPFSLTPAELEALNS